MLVQEIRHKFSVREYLALFDQGIVPSTTKTELINGQIIDLRPLGFRHAKTQQLIQNFLIDSLNTSDVYQNGSIIVDDNNMPEPDVYVLKPNVSIEGNYPRANQLQMVVEVADPTISTDLINDGSGKLGIYASAGIPLVWIIDVNKRSIYEFGQPNGPIFQSCKVHIGSTTLFNKSILVENLIAS